MVEKRFIILKKTRLDYMGGEYYEYYLKDKLTNNIILTHKNNEELKNVCGLLNNFWQRMVEYEHTLREIDDWYTLIDNNNHVTPVSDIHTHKVSLEDVCGICKSPNIEGRFKEVISTEKIIDTETGIEYDGYMDSELLRLINRII